MDTLTEVKQNLKRLETLLDRSAVSLAIQTLVPDAFENGKARVRFSSRFPHKERQDFSVTINDTYVFEAVNIPDVLWNDRQSRKQQHNNNES